MGKQLTTQCKVQRWDHRDAEELLEGKVNFSGKKTWEGFFKEEHFNWPEGWEEFGRWKLTGSVVRCKSWTQRRESFPTHYHVEEKNQGELSWFVTFKTLSRKHEGLPFIINRISIRSFSLIRFQSSSKDLINNSLFLSVIFICKFFLDWVNT